MFLLERSSLEPREYAALAWVRAFLTIPPGVPADVENEFRTALTRDERLLVQSVMKGMFCTNLTVNTWRWFLGTLGLRFRGENGPARACRL